MKLHSTNNRKAPAFTLIEMIGVLAVIAILAALLIPKVFNAINEARVNGVSVSTATVKTAVVDHYGKYGGLDSLFGTNATVTFTGGIYAGYDTNILMVEALLDKPFAAAISTNATIQLCQTAKDNGGSGYKLDGVNNGTGTATYIVEAMLQGVTVQDAKDLNDIIDGTALGAPVGTGRHQGTGRIQLYDRFWYSVHLPNESVASALRQLADAAREIVRAGGGGVDRPPGASPGFTIV